MTGLPASRNVSIKLVQGIRPAVEDQIFRQFAVFRWDFSIGGDLGRIDDGHIQTGLHGMVEHDAVQNRPGSWRQAKGDIADAQRGQHAGQFGFDQADAFQVSMADWLIPGRRWPG